MIFLSINCKRLVNIKAVPGTGMLTVEFPVEERMNEKMSKRVHLKLLYSTLLHMMLPRFSTVSEDAGIAPRTVATLALAVRRSLTTQTDLIHRRLNLIHIKRAPDLFGQHNSVDPHKDNR